MWIGFEFGLPENQNRVAGKLDVKLKPECKTNDQNRSETASIENERDSNENETDIDLNETTGFLFLNFYNNYQDYIFAYI